MKKIPPSKPHKIAETTALYRVEQVKQSLPIEHIRFDKEKIAGFCRRWKISEFSLFGSVLRQDFRPDSDVDVLVSFDEQAGWSLWDLVEMQDELEKIFARKVDLVEKEALRNPYRRHSILSGREIFYVTS